MPASPFKRMSGQITGADEITEMILSYFMKFYIVISWMPVCLKSLLIAGLVHTTRRKMLVPKFSFEFEGSWHIHWPKDQPHVVHSKSQNWLVVKLTTLLQQLDRIENQRKHVDPEYA